jgi:hypothetical protein
MPGIVEKRTAETEQAESSMISNSMAILIAEHVAALVMRDQQQNSRGSAALPQELPQAPGAIMGADASKSVVAVNASAVLELSSTSRCAEPPQSRKDAAAAKSERAHEPQSGNFVVGRRGADAHRNRCRVCSEWRRRSRRGQSKCRRSGRRRSWSGRQWRDQRRRRCPWTERDHLPRKRWVQRIRIRSRRQEYGHAWHARNHQRLRLSIQAEQAASPFSISRERGRGALKASRSAAWTYLMR